MSSGEERLRIGNRTVSLSHPNKVLFPQDGITKCRVVSYYRRVAPAALPFLRDRFLTLQRFPDGLDGSGFFQQAYADYFPDFVERVAAPLASGGQLEHIVVKEAAGLVYLAEQATLTFHGWLSRRDKPDHPDRLVIDLDPADENFPAVAAAALRVREALEQAGLSAFVMTTGSRGLHVVAPLDRKNRFATVRDFAADLAGRLAAEAPDDLTTEQRKDRRRGRIYLDVMRNAYGQTAVLPYSLRAKPGAPVATPLRWDELRKAGMAARRYRVDNLFRRLARIDDPWAGFQHRASSPGRVRS